MEAMGMMRDLDQIRERDDSRESGRLVLVSVGGLAAACVLFAVGVLIGREGDSTRASRREDPLARLDALAGQVADAGTPQVTYPDRLVDSPAAATAAAAPNAQGAGATGAAGADSVAMPAAAQTARPEVVRASAHVPASALVETTGRVREALPTAAQLPAAPAHLRPASEVAPSAPTAPAPVGSEGPFTLQVSSFRAAGSAQVFAQRLRERGHRAFVVSGPSGTTGTNWHRVRIGPFTSQRDADRYRAGFESRERLPTFVVRRDEASGHESR